MFKRITYYIVLLLVVQHMNCFSQDLTPPDKPNIRYVTIDTATNDVEIYWTPSLSSDLKYYFLYYQVNTPNGPEGVRIDTADRDQSSYTHLIGGAGFHSLLYSITAEDSLKNESLRLPGLHSTIYTQLKYDSCQNTITIGWD